MIYRMSFCCRGSPEGGSASPSGQAPPPRDIHVCSAGVETGAAGKANRFCSSVGCHRVGQFGARSAEPGNRHAGVSRPPVRLQGPL